MNRIDYISTRAREQSIVLVFANYAYLPVVRIWLECAGRINLDNFVIVALDETIFDILNAEDIPTVLTPTPTDLASIWSIRMELIEEIIEQDIEVIHSDADALWLRDPRPLFSAIKADLIFSQGTVWPLEVFQQWQFVLCCGLFCLRPTQAVRELTGLWAKATTEAGDDQEAINFDLLQRHTSWDIPEPYLRQYEGREFQCSRSVIHGSVESPGCSIAVAPHHLISRVPDRTDNPMIIHPVTDKNASHKTRTLLTLIESFRSNA